MNNSSAARDEEARDQHLYKVPALFWLDHEDRSPSDRPEQMAELQSIQGRIAYVMANAEQLECLRSDAQFYAEGNVDGCESIVRSAKATLEAIARATTSPLTTAGASGPLGDPDVLASPTN